MAELSHEIRTPLSGLVGALRLIGRREHLDRKLMGHAIEAGESLLSVVNDSLTGSARKVDSSGSDRQRVDIVQLATSVAELMKVEAEEKGLQFRMELADSTREARWVRVDRQKVRQILTNLLHNAIKFTHSGCVRLTLSATARAQSDEFILDIRVSDSGIGIEPAQCERIFDDYVQVGEGAEGAGLGLAITRRLVSSLGGSVSVESEPGAGSCFRVDLPVHRAAEPESSTEDANQEGVIVGARDVLVVEDDPINRAIVVELLSLDGHRVVATAEPLEALESLREGGFDLCLLDIRLPGMTGTELLARARRLQTDSEVWFVALTANTSESDIAQYRAAGFDQVMEKPVDRQCLRLALARCKDRTSANFFLHSDMQAAGLDRPLVDKRLWQNIVSDLGQERAQNLLSEASTALQRYLAEVEQALATGDLPTVKASAHKMKSAGRSVGMVSVANIAHHIEADPSRAMSALSNLGNLIGRSVEQLQQ